MNRLLPRFAVLMGLSLLAACADGDLPVKDSTEFSAPFSAHSVIFNNSSSVSIMGNNGSGQLGNNTIINLATPSTLKLSFSLAGNPAPISTGGSHTLAFANLSTVRAWGSNASGQLGQSPSILGSSSVPVKVAGFTTSIKAVAAGGSHSLALDSNGAVWAWGGNANGQAAFKNVSTVRSVPAIVPSLGITATGIAAGGSHSIAFDATQVRAWGRNSNGQLGNDSTVDSITPVLVQGLANVTKVAAGGSHNLALDNLGQLRAWGYNGFGQLGDGSVADRKISFPVAIPGNPSIVDIGAGADHSVVVTSDGRVWTWGYNVVGQLGYSTFPNLFQTMPKQIVTDADGGAFADVQRIVLMGGNHTVVRKNDGTYWAWGYNAFGQLGDGTTINRFAPRKITLP